MTTSPRRNETILGTARKAGDLETRIRIIEVDGLMAVELRDWIPSLEEYGRGYWIPADTAEINHIVQGLLSASNEVERRKREQEEGAR